MKPDIFSALIMKAVKIILLTLAVIFIIIQFMPDGIPENMPEDENSLDKSGMVPEPVLIQLRTSCYDCHSSQTYLPWYSKVAPFSWLLADHIEEGRAHLNFSEWGTYNTRKKIGILDEIIDEVESGAMPLKSYLLIHRDARLDTEDISNLSSWVEETTSRMLE